ncbi:bifunctional homocysteine S-methyltransferase/methylenetetrahydrofolate reductase [Faecalibacterium sp. Marseille-Q0746]|jgi:methionine synthase I (cobalamin-dependent)/5,10-methylenetetrahydrofolate reductase|uniref:bifunctional homocysteine S-methyltransferase/methylenetetrahydrofolate reductase n=1 Tax=Faecalibacterium sp. Marseille-Q0746 TaxID=2817019 RepID=UPI0008215716|nr:bifunctional homocysteine S-methyltransferase/methylenetetrahydrofolate reductase [Faecalibacterium sp. Marseille-Q0746]MBO1345485.1 bifunctional homocysteine S-methyltransferase/methylenetetrahydrofolate reductase [Faecalibacterium sp. Marseille-Q0746]SCH82370.1 Methionine synthase [uncultured Faecalibacterium sp.]
MKDIRELLQTRPLLFDGAMGTYYKAAPGVECEQANLTDPAGVLAVHREYLAAGADAVKTNTFSLPRLAAAHTPGWEQLAQAGWQLAVQAAEETDAAVFADLGPAPDTEAVPAGQVYTAVAKQFAALGARNFLFETLSSDAGLLDAVGAIKAEVPDAFVLVSFAVLPDGYTREGMYCKDLARRMQESGIVDAVGLNCVSAPGAMRTLAKQLGGTLPLSVMPNAGYPVVTRTQVKYQGRPEYFARELGRLAAEGTVQILGGCCGTTPAHIAALRAELDSLPVVEKTAPAEEFSTMKKQTVENEDAFLRKLNGGEKVIAIELDSPRNADLTGYLEGAKKLQAAGADLLTIADCPIAQARMDSSLVACRVHRELGLCTLPHMTCRDRNLNATKALLLGLYAEGVREVLAITGDPIPTAERDEVKNVYQFNSRKLAQYIVSLAGEGREMPGPMTVFGALNLNARNFDVELRRAKEKLENGMSGFLTQPVLSAQAVENLKKSRETLGADAKILAGIMPVVSQRNAIFMENEINGIHVEDWIIEKFAGLDRAQGEELGLAISLEMAKAALPYADGLYLMTPFNRVALMERLIGRLKQEVLGAY